MTTKTKKLTPPLYMTSAEAVAFGHGAAAERCAIRDFLLKRAIHRTVAADVHLALLELIETFGLGGHVVDDESIPE